MKAKVIVQQTYEWSFEIEGDSMSDIDRKARQYFHNHNNINDAFRGHPRFKEIKEELIKENHGKE